MEGSASIELVEGLLLRRNVLEEKRRGRGCDGMELVQEARGTMEELGSVVVAKERIIEALQLWQLSVDAATLITDMVSYKAKEFDGISSSSNFSTRAKSRPNVGV